MMFTNEIRQAAIDQQLEVLTPMSAGQAEAMIRALAVLRALTVELARSTDEPGAGAITAAARKGLVFAAELAAEALGPDEERFLSALGLDRGHIEATTESPGSARMNAAALLGYLKAVIPGVNSAGDVGALRDRGDGRLCVASREIEAAEAGEADGQSRLRGSDVAAAGPLPMAACGRGSGGYL